MRMIDRIKQAMRDTGVCDSMSDEDLDIAVTAALEEMREPTRYMLLSGMSANVGLRSSSHGYIYRAMIYTALGE